MKIGSRRSPSLVRAAPALVAIGLIALRYRRLRRRGTASFLAGSSTTPARDQNKDRHRLEHY